MLRRQQAQPLFACTFLLIAFVLRAQDAQPTRPMIKDVHPSFEVATIKPHDPSTTGQGFEATGNRIMIRNEDLIAILTVYYSLHRSQIVGLPNWANDAWDIEGIPNTAGQPDLRQQQEMVQKLLADRFGLKFHPELRELPVFVIEIAKGGAKLKPAAKPDEQTGQHASGAGGVATFDFTSTNMTDFILCESLFVDRPLVDHTGLSGKYDFTLRYNFKENSENSNSAPGLLTAVQEELGLKFVPAKTAVEVLIIDHIDRPSAN